MCTIYNFPQYYYCKVISSDNTRGRLLGSFGLISLIGEDLAVKMLNRVNLAKSDKVICKLRRGLQFNWYVK